MKESGECMADRIQIDTGILEELKAQIDRLQSSLTDIIGDFASGMTDDLSFSPDDLAAYIVSGSTLASIAQTNDARYILNALELLENPSPSLGDSTADSMYKDVLEQKNTSQIGQYAGQKSESGGTKTQAFARALYALKP